MEVRSQKAYWDGVAGEKCFAHPLRLDWLASHLTVGHTILDCGYGYGRILVELAQNGYHNAVGADFSFGMLRRCRQLIPPFSLVQADAERLPFRECSFDAVLLFALLTSMPLEAQQRALFSEVQRILRVGGLIYVSDLLLNTDRRNVDRYERFAERFGAYGIFQLPEGVTVRHHTEDWIRCLAAGFDCIAYEPFTVTTMNGHTSAAFQYLGRLR
jgi:SAM-dependent methyltransferase